MHCKEHHHQPATNTCSKCGEWICEECAVEIKGRNICKSCIEKYSFGSGGYPSGKAKPHVNGFAVFVFSLVPGAAHMYLGYTKMGLLYMSLFFGNIFITASISGMFGLLFPIIWLTSFFDANNLKKRIRAGEVIADNPSEYLSWMNKYKIWIAAILIGVGLLEGMKEMRYLLYQIPYMSTLFRRVENMIIPAILIIGGLWLVGRSRRDKEIGGHTLPERDN